MPLTADRAKPAVPFGGDYRLIDFALSNLINSGLRQIVVLTQYKSHSLDRHVSQTWRLSGLLELLRRLGARAAAPGQALVQRLGRRDPAEPQPAARREARHRRRRRRRPRLPHGLQPDDRRPHRVGRGRHGRRHPPADRARRPVRRDRGRARTTRPRSRRSSRSRQNPVGLADSPGEVLASMGNYVFDADVLIEAVLRDGELPDSNHDMGGDIVPDFVSRGRGGRLRPQPQRGAGLDRSRPLLLARRREPSTRSSTRTRTSSRRCRLQPLQQRLADLQPAAQLAAGEVRARRARATSARRSTRSSRSARVLSGAHIERSVLGPVGDDRLRRARSSTRSSSTACASGRTPSCAARYSRQGRRGRRRARPSASIRDADRARGFTVTDSGITVVGKGVHVSLISSAPRTTGRLRRPWPASSSCSTSTRP